MGLRKVDPFPYLTYPPGLLGWSENIPRGHLIISSAGFDPGLISHTSLVYPERLVLSGVHSQRCQSGAILLVRQVQPLQQWGREGQLKTMA